MFACGYVRRTHPKYLFKDQPPCCSLSLRARGRLTSCGHCWKPILGDVMVAPSNTSYDPGEYADAEE